MEAWSIKTLWRDYWRVPVIALLGGLLAFGGSFAFAPTYASSTKLLVRGRDATFLTTTGADLSAQPGVVDSSLAKALGETQSALITSRAVAEKVVDQLDLAQPKPEPSGWFAKTRRFLGDGYKRTRAILTFGFYKEPELRAGTIAAVHSGLTAAPVRDSYVLELVATADDPQLAADIANAAADALVEVSTARFRADAESYRDQLKTQFDQAAEQERLASEAIIARRYALGIDATGRSDSEVPPVELAALGRLEEEQSIASARYREVATEYQEAQANVERPRVEVTRVDEADVPLYPIKPVRYLYLGVGLVFGAVIGFFWSWYRLMKRQRREEDTEPDVSEPEVDLRQAEAAEAVLRLPVWSTASRSPNGGTTS